MARLVGADPFSLDRPGADALMIRIVASKVTVLDEAPTGMSAGEVDDLELVSSVGNGSF